LHYCCSCYCCGTEIVETCWFQNILYVMLTSWRRINVFCLLRYTHFQLGRLPVCSSLLWCVACHLNTIKILWEIFHLALYLQSVMVRPTSSYATAGISFTLLVRYTIPFMTLFVAFRRHWKENFENCTCIKLLNLYDKKMKSNNFYPWMLWFRQDKYFWYEKYRM
jgi:hypothetical protein